MTNVFLFGVNYHFNTLFGRYRVTRLVCSLLQISLIYITIFFFMDILMLYHNIVYKGSIKSSTSVYYKVMLTYFQALAKWFQARITPEFK